MRHWAATVDEAAAGAPGDVYWLQPVGKAVEQCDRKLPVRFEGAAELDVAGAVVESRAERVEAAAAGACRR